MLGSVPWDRLQSASQSAWKAAHQASIVSWSSGESTGPWKTPQVIPRRTAPARSFQTTSLFVVMTIWTLTFSRYAKRTRPHLRSLDWCPRFRVPSG